MPRRHAAIVGCVLAFTALGPATVPTLTQSSLADTTATVAGRRPPPGMIEALQRDLHLTEEQVHTRLLNEARLTEVEAELRAKLGTRFGGSWLEGTTAQTLVVATTNPADLPQITAAGATGRYVRHSLANLNEMLKVFDRQWAPSTKLYTRYVDVMNNRVAMTLQPQSRLLGPSGPFPEMVGAVDSPEIPMPPSDVVGGRPYYISGYSRCSIGFSVMKGTQKGFVTAGHCGAAGKDITAFDRTPLGTFQAANFPENDYAWVAVNDGWTLRPWVDNGADGTVDVAGSREALVGASVCRSGSTSGLHCGLILQRNASADYQEGMTTGMVRTNVCAERGDSGGSFIWIDQAQGVLSGGGSTDNCDLRGVAPFQDHLNISYFQPVGEILTAYDLTLVSTDTDNRQTPCTGYPGTATGTLTGGRSAYQPSNGFYQSTTAGVHAACLDGPAGVDFDLELQKRSGSDWTAVATSDGPSPDEQISYTGTAGEYRYRVTSFSGTGPYTLKYTTP